MHQWGLFYSYTLLTLIEANISQSSSSWYEVMTQELGSAEDIVIKWRQNGYLYFQQDVLKSIISAGENFIASKSNIDSLFGQLKTNFSESTKNEIVKALNDLNQPIASMSTEIGNFLDKLKAYQIDMETPYANMNKTVSQVQSEAGQIQSEITSINDKIAQLKSQVIADRKAIASAKRKRDEGIGETIFGIILAPFTGGLSLILVGIGVASIAEGEEKVSQLESSISKYQTGIVNDQANLNQDEKQISTLNGLTMSMEIALDDMSATQTALDSLRTTWSYLEGSLTTASQKVEASNSAPDALLEQVWYNAAWNVWSEIVPFCQTLIENNAPVAKRVTVG
jgi:predicted  nucleic acid-binding Zn-ribbon protein